MVTIGSVRKSSPAREIGFGHLLRRGQRFRDDFVGKNMRQMVLANDDFDVDANFAGASKNFDHACRQAQGRPLG